MKTLDDILEEVRIKCGGRKMKSVMMIALDEDDNVIHLMCGNKNDMKYSLAVSADRKREMREIVDKVSATLKHLDAQDKARHDAQQRLLNRVINLFEQATDNETKKLKTKDNKTKDKGL